MKNIIILHVNIINKLTYVSTMVSLTNIIKNTSVLMSGGLWAQGIEV